MQTYRKLQNLLSGRADISAAKPLDDEKFVGQCSEVSSVALSVAGFSRDSKT